jgi:hypothetical protein
LAADRLIRTAALGDPVSGDLLVGQRGPDQPLAGPLQPQHFLRRPGRVGEQCGNLLRFAQHEFGDGSITFAARPWPQPRRPSRPGSPTSGGIRPFRAARRPESCESAIAITGCSSYVSADSPVAAGGAAAFADARSTTPPYPGNPAGRRSASMPPRVPAYPANRWSTTEHPLPADRPGCRGWPRPARDPGSAGPAARLVSVVAALTAYSPCRCDLPFVLPSCGRPSASPEIRLKTIAVNGRPLS